MSETVPSALPAPPAEERVALLRKLLEDVSSAARGAEALDNRIYCLAHGWDSMTIDHDPFPRYYVRMRTAAGREIHQEIPLREIPSYTSSVDDALALLHSTFAGWGLGLEVGLYTTSAQLLPPDRSRAHGESLAPTPPLSIVSAVLRTSLELQAPEAAHE